MKHYCSLFIAILLSLLYFSSTIAEPSVQATHVAQPPDIDGYVNETVWKTGGLITEFLGILDNLERSVEAAKEKHQDYEAFLKGIEMVMAHVHEMLKNNGVTPVETEGKMFEPHCHEVLMQEEKEDIEDGMVIEEFQKGYRLGEKVIRTAKVKVARKKE